MAERITYFVDVIIPLSVPNKYTYRVPFELNNEVGIGKRAVVPFGKSKLYTSIIARIHEEAPTTYQAKYINSILDDEPIITPQQFKLWHWISDYYMAPIGDVMNAALPSNFKLASESKIVLHPEFERNYDILTDKEYLIVEALEVQEVLTLKDIGDILQIKTIQPVINDLIKKHVVVNEEELKHKFQPKLASFVFLSELFLEEKFFNETLQNLESNKRSEKQALALLTLLKLDAIKNQQIQPIKKSMLIDHQISNSTLLTLEKKDLIHIERLEISRFELEEEKNKPKKELSEEQARALHEIRHEFDKKDTVLLHGVTGSGKTEIYVELIDEQIKQNKQVLFLLPEIALTTQLITRLKKYFGNQVGVYHSKFNQNERIEIWNQVLRNNTDEFKIILGARSSLFLPWQNLGLIIIDEEHENTFKQYDPAPRYHARDTAIVLAKLNSAKVLLGSATPSIESYYNTELNKYGLVELNERFGNLPLPEIQCADLQKERKRKEMNGHFSSFLLTAIKEALDKEEQVILFQNRRGYTPIWLCEMCGWAPKCKNCDVSLTYHKNINILKCHYCGYFTPPVGSCGACGSNKLKMQGFGTEKIEDDLSLILPKATIARLDLDSTRSKSAYSRILTEFEERRVDILIGTQMVSKGLDFDNVSLVGILNADTMLNFPDFRAFERSYQLMSQVSGRAGRKSKRGKVIIQTTDPNHWIVQKVMYHDYINMYKQELIERKNFNYPPFFKLIHITLKHKDLNLVKLASKELAKHLKKPLGNRVLGPEQPMIARIRNQYLEQINIKFEREASAKKVKEFIETSVDQFYAQPQFKSVRISIDVDPA